MKSGGEGGERGRAEASQPTTGSSQTLKPGEGVTNRGFADPTTFGPQPPTSPLLPSSPTTLPCVCLCVCKFQVCVVNFRTNPALNHPEGTPTSGGQGSKGRRRSGGGGKEGGEGFVQEQNRLEWIEVWWMRSAVVHSLMDAKSCRMQSGQ